MKKVSFIVRTCGRPHILKYSLQSIREQTYPNIEVVVVEDGENISENMIRNDFSDMDIKYCNTGEKVGRAKVGNIAMQMSEGEYLNFLDDDDLLYPKHTEILMNAIEQGEYRIAYAIAHEATSVYWKKEQRYVTLKKCVKYRQKFCRLLFTINNYIPIQTVMFHRSLFMNYGGFRAGMDALEDWDLWLRYAAHEDFLFVDAVTSMYRVPLRWVKRDKILFHAYDDAIKLFAQYGYHYNFEECNRELNYILNELKCPLWKKGLRKIRNRIYGK